MKVEEELSVTQVLQLAPSLVPDSTSESCMACRRAFSLFFRRHHCRFCGRLLCGSCTAARVQVDTRRLRACEKCLDAYTKRLQATREQRLLLQKQRELQRHRQQSVLPPELKDEETPQKKEVKEVKEDGEAAAEIGASSAGSGRDSLRGRSFEQATSGGKKSAAGRPRRSNTMLPSDRKSATMQPAASAGAKKASYRKSLRSARSERQLRSAAGSSFSAAPESEIVAAAAAAAYETQEEEREEECTSSSLQEADNSLARLTEEDGRVSTVGAVVSSTTATTTEGDSVAVSGESPSLAGVDVIGMLPDIAAATAAMAATASTSPPPAADPLEEGCAALYIGKDGVPHPATVLKAHFDDYPHLYYTIRLDESGRERQTDAARLQRV